ncbi:MAG TPA: glycosyltransferase family 2 protein [Gammaproteobacteria bacterium]|mgnify:CR=1 FL=1|nr:glycosyltransferase family 2 protein [Gammaproteobacteria bacterium]
MTVLTEALITVIIPNWNGLHYLQQCLPALSQQTFEAFRIIVVDNGSSDDSCHYIIAQFPQIQLIRFPENTGFAFACNAGIKAADTTWIALLNNDTKPQPGWLQALVNATETYDVGVAAYTSCMIQMNSPNLMDDGGDILNWRGGTFKRGNGQQADLYSRDEEVMLPCAGAAMYRRQVLIENGGFDPVFYAYLEDVDLGLRLRLQGYRCIYVANAVVLHTGHGSKIATDKYIFLTARNRILLFLKNIPFTLLFLHTGALVYGWLFYYLAHRCAWMYLRGTLAVVKYLPHIIRSRRKLARHKQLDHTKIKALLTHPWPEITLSELVVIRLKEIIHRYRRPS